MLVPVTNVHHRQKNKKNIDRIMLFALLFWLSQLLDVWYITPKSRGRRKSVSPKLMPIILPDRKRSQLIPQYHNTQILSAPILSPSVVAACLPTATVAIVLGRKSQLWFRFVYILGTLQLYVIIRRSLSSTQLRAALRKLLLSDEISDSAIRHTRNASASWQHPAST